MGIISFILLLFDICGKFYLPHLFFFSYSTISSFFINTVSIYTLLISLSVHSLLIIFCFTLTNILYLVSQTSAIREP